MNGLRSGEIPDWSGKKPGLVRGIPDWSGKLRTGDRPEMGNLAPDWSRKIPDWCGRIPDWCAPEKMGSGLVRTNPGLVRGIRTGPEKFRTGGRQKMCSGLVRKIPDWSGKFRTESAWRTCKLHVSDRFYKVAQLGLRAGSGLVRESQD